MKNNITIVLTSCWRYELLEKTIKTIEKTIDLSIYKKIITEDSKNEKHIKKIKESNKNWFLRWWKIIYTWWSNQKNIFKCHYQALKTLYKNINTKYVFHCEDDLIFKKVNFNYIKLSYDILENNNKIAIVLLRDLFKDYWLKKIWIMKSRYYEILTNNELTFYWHTFIELNKNESFTLQPWLRNTNIIKKVMFWFEDYVNEWLVSKRLSNLWYYSIVLKNWIFYNPTPLLNSTRNIQNMWFFPYIILTLKWTLKYRSTLIYKFIKNLFKK